MINTFIFDFGGVLGPDSNDWDHNFKIIKTLTNLSANNLDQILEQFWPQLKIGKSKTLSFWKAVSLASPLKPSPETLERAYLDATSINETSFQIALKLAGQSYRLAILSNEAREWMDYKIKKFNLKKHFSSIYCSAHLGLAKPDLAIYQFVLKDLASNPKDLVFIDNLPQNLPPAENLGITTILYQNPKQVEQNLIAYLPR